MNRGSIELEVGELSNMEARVVARYRPAAGDGPHERERIMLRGTLRGPYCEHARTLPAEYAFRDVGPGEAAAAEAVVPDPCLWSPELPHVYHADVEAVRGEQLVAEYHGQIGLRKAGPQHEAREPE